MLRIYVARHGQDEDNAAGILNGWRDSPLTLLGLSQARALAGNIVRSGLSFDSVYASPLRRAFMTAATVVEAVGGWAPCKLPLLIERDFGVMTGQPVASIAERCAPDILQADPILYFLKPAGGETYPQLLERAHDALAYIRSERRDGNVLIVTHGDIGKMLYAAYYGLAWRDVLLQFHFGNGELILLAEDSPAEKAHVFQVEQHNH